MRPARIAGRDRPSLSRNNGDGTFTETTQKAGVGDTNAYYGLASVFVDVNNDGKVDLAVADDSTPNYLYINKGNGTFEDDSYASGYALNQDGRETASMGIAVGDFQNNGLIDLANTTFSDDYKVLYRNDGDANFTDVSYKMGIAQATIPFWGGATDFWITTTMDGRTSSSSMAMSIRTVDKNDWGTTIRGASALVSQFEGTEVRGRAAGERTLGLADVIAGRGGAFGDLFNDGKIDVVINVMDGTPVLLRNVNDDHHHWVELKLVGGR